MAERITVQMWETGQAHRALNHVWLECIKPMLVAQHRMILEVKPMKRSLPQNNRLHSLLTELSVQADWCGQKLPMEVWKRLCMAAWMREENKKPLLIPALDGHGFDIIYEKTSRLSVEDCSKFMLWVEAFAAEKGIVLGVDMETGEVK